MGRRWAIREMQSDWLGDCFFNKYRARWMDFWAISLSGPETTVNCPSQPFQASMHGKGGDVGLHAREADVHACERGERGALGERGELG